VKQISFMRKAAQDLFELINDLLDLAKVEAGKVVVRPGEFDVEHLFGALRGMLRPLLVHRSLNLVFEDTSGLPSLMTDESKVSQILRNFISNALKFTEQGEVRVAARLSDDGDSVVFSVKDTGIGIAAEDQDKIFEEFAQLDNYLQRRVRGTGLGLPLTRQLAHLLGGRVWLESELGVGSTFYVSVARMYHPAEAVPAPEAAAPSRWEADPARVPVLIVEDDPEMMHTYQGLLRGTLFQLVPARSTAEAAAYSPNAPAPRHRPRRRAPERGHLELAGRAQASGCDARPPGPGGDPDRRSAESPGARRRRLRAQAGGPRLAAGPADRLQRDGRIPPPAGDRRRRGRALSLPQSAA
jgi:hypothetical protein